MIHIEKAHIVTRGNQKDFVNNIKISWILIAQKHVDSVSVSITDIFPLKSSHSHTSNILGPTRDLDATESRND